MIRINRAEWPIHSFRDEFVCTSSTARAFCSSYLSFSLSQLSKITAHLRLQSIASVEIELSVWCKNLSIARSGIQYTSVSIWQAVSFIEGGAC